MTALEFFWEILTFTGDILNGIFDELFNFVPVNIVISVLLGLLGFSIVFGIIRGRKM